MGERVSLIGTRGALVEMDAYAVGIGPEPPHPLTPEQRESNLGLDGYVRVV